MFSRQTHIPPEPIISLPDSQCTVAEEKKLTRKMLGELSTLWEERFNHSFTAKLPRNAPDEELASKMSRADKKKRIMTKSDKLSNKLANTSKKTQL